MKRKIGLACLLPLGMALSVTAGGRSSRVELRDQVEVRKPIILLSDLLPENASAQLMDEARSILLGGTPQPGELRLLSPVVILHELADAPEMLAAISIPAQIAVRNPGWPITDAAIETAVRERLLQQGWAKDKLPTPDQILWPRINAAAPDPKLEVVSANWDFLQRALALQLRCIDRSACGSFQATVFPGSFAEDQLKTLLWRRKSTNQKAATQLYSGTSPRSPVLIQAGDSATLVLKSTGLRFSLPVICLQPGGVGQTIRAREAGGQHVYQAEIIGRRELRALF